MFFVKKPFSIKQLIWFCFLFRKEKSFNLSKLSWVFLFPLPPLHKSIKSRDKDVLSCTPSIRKRRKDTRTWIDGVCVDNRKWLKAFPAALVKFWIYILSESRRKSQIRLKTIFQSQDEVFQVAGNSMLHSQFPTLTFWSIFIFKRKKKNLFCVILSVKHFYRMGLNYLNVLKRTRLIINKFIYIWNKSIQKKKWYKTWIFKTL